MWWARLPVAEGANRERSLLVRDKRQALQAIAALSSCFEGRFRERSIVYAVAAGKVTVPEFMEAFNLRQLEELADQIANPVANLNDHVDGWQEWLRGRGRTTEGTRTKYLQQLRALVPEGNPFPASQFTSKSISVFLSGLTLNAPNRYRAALSSFGKYLKEREVLGSNPVRDVESAKERAPRVRSLSRTEAQKLVGAISSAEARTVHALMCGSGMEIGAVLTLRRRDIDLEAKTVHAHGTKRLSRDRVVRVPESWCWELLVSWLRDRRLLPDAQIFQLSYCATRRALKSACKAVGVDNYRSHDWRHTYAVQARRDGYSDQVIAHQLGHKTTAMVQAVYGRYTPTEADYRRSQTVGQTVASDGLRIGAGQSAIR